MAVDPHRVGNFRIGSSRIGVIDPLFEGWKAQDLTVEVTRRKRIVSPSSDLYTQHPNPSWTETTIDVRIRLGPAGREDTDIGVFGLVDGIIRTGDSLKLGDRIDHEGSRYEVATPLVPLRERGGFLYRKCGIKRVELEEI